MNIIMATNTSTLSIRLPYNFCFLGLLNWDNYAIYGAFAVDADFAISKSLLRRFLRDPKVNAWVRKELSQALLALEETVWPVAPRDAWLFAESGAYTDMPVPKDLQGFGVGVFGAGTRAEALHLLAQAPIKVM